MTAREYQEWQELYRIEPWGDDWLQASTIAAVTEGVWSKRPFRRDRFVPRPKSNAAPETDPQLIEAQMQRFAAAHNARVEREEQQRKAAEAAMRQPPKLKRTHVPVPKQQKGAPRKPPAR